LTRQLATWSFALLVIGAAVVDTTILAKEPKRQQANVEVTQAEQPTAPRRSRGLTISECYGDRVPDAPDVHPGLTAAVVDPFARRVRFMDVREPRPKNRIDVDGGTYTVRIPGAQTTVELRGNPGCTIHVNAQSAPSPARVELAPGRYRIWQDCDTATFLATQLDIVAESSR
jgi:hypothetical protein